MAQDQKYISLARLQEYDVKSKALMDSKDAEVVKKAKDYADSLAVNYDAAGTAATKVKELADGQVKTNTDDITVLKDSKADKATTLEGYGITDAYTREQTDTKIAEAVATADHLKRTIVTQLPEVADADPNTIYMVPKSGKSAENTYDEYFLIVTQGSEGEVRKFEKIGDSAVDLTDYATKDYVDKAKQEAVDTASTDATSKANKALSDAKAYADGLGVNYATAAQGAKADSAVQTADIIENDDNTKWVATINIKGEQIHLDGEEDFLLRIDNIAEKTYENYTYIQETVGYYLPQMIEHMDAAPVEATSEDIDAMFA